jgi:NDP-sugar pyrophosphorylase family protein
LQAVILAAGEGTRLHPITDHIPKPLIPFWGKPFISYLLDSLESFVDEVIIVRSPDPRIEDALGDRHGSLPLRYAIQDKPRGTGDAVLCCREMIEGPFILNLGDTLAPQETVEALLGTPGDAVVTLIEVDDPDNHLGITTNGDATVCAIWTDSCTVDAGVFRLSPSIFDALDGLPPRGKELRLMQGIERILREDGDVRAVRTPQPWLQFGDHEKLPGVLRVMKQMRNGAGVPDAIVGSSVDIAAHAGCEINESLVFGPGELVNCTVTNSMVYCATRLEGMEIDGEMVAYD